MTTPVNRDPDQLECYSDHAHDIRTTGECMICTSTEVDVVGHVLPSAARYTGVDPVKAAAIVLKHQQHALFDGIALDTFSASAIQSVHEAVNETNRARLRAMTLPQAVDFCFRLINKVREKQS